MVGSAVLASGAIYAMTRKKQPDPETGEVKPRTFWQKTGNVLVKTASAAAIVASVLAFARGGANVLQGGEGKIASMAQGLNKQLDKPFTWAAKILAEKAAGPGLGGLGGGS